MGTRCITVVKMKWGDEEAVPVATIYRHWDGYPDGQGRTLAEFLDGLVLVNGIGVKMPEKYANGPGRVAAQLVAYMQAGNNEPDLMPHGSACGQEYEYHVTCAMGVGMDSPNTISVEAYAGPLEFFGMGGENCTNRIFSGSAEEYVKWITSGAFNENDEKEAED